MSADETAFLTRDGLFAVGFTLLFAGFVLRGFARSARRSLALRREHELHVRAIGSPPRAGETARTTHFERCAGRYVVACAVLAAMIIIAAFFRR